MRHEVANVCHTISWSSTPENCFAHAEREIDFIVNADGSIAHPTKMSQKDEDEDDGPVYNKEIFGKKLIEGMKLEYSEHGRRVIVFPPDLKSPSRQRAVNLAAFVQETSNVIPI